MDDSVSARLRVVETHLASGQRNLVVVPVTNVLTGLVALCWFARGDWTAGKLTDDVRQIVQVTDETIVEEGLR